MFVFLRFGAEVSRLRVEACGLRVQGSGFRIQGFGYTILTLPLFVPASRVEPQQGGIHLLRSLNGAGLLDA
jgi:hypothetical protein